MSRLISLRVALQLVELLAVIGQTYRRQNHPERFRADKPTDPRRLSVAPARADKSPGHDRISCLGVRARSAVV